MKNTGEIIQTIAWVIAIVGSVLAVILGIVLLVLGSIVGFLWSLFSIIILCISSIILYGFGVLISTQLESLKYIKKIAKEWKEEEEI